MMLHLQRLQHCPSNGSLLTQRNKHTNPEKILAITYVAINNPHCKTRLQNKFCSTHPHPKTNTLKQYQLSFTILEQKIAASKNAMYVRVYVCFPHNTN